MEKNDAHGIDICENRTGGGAELCQNVCPCYRTVKHGCFIAKTMKMTTCFRPKRPNRANLHNLLTSRKNGLLKVVRTIFASNLGPVWSQNDDKSAKSERVYFFQKLSCACLIPYGYKIDMAIFLPTNCIKSA